MEAKGLNIDNLVYKFKDDKRVVSKITGYDLYTWQLNGKQWAKIEPIGLTEEWFKKSQFKKQKTFGQSNYWQIEIKNDWIGFYEIDNIWYWDNTFTKTVKFVHNLQNFIIELTGNELEIK